jgi:murein DD-endopeptidase MepM/ murein hydrolase activator NlpD
LRIAVAAQVALIAVGSGAAMAAQSGGGITAPRPPLVTDVVCQNKCVGLREANPGARVQLTGRNLSYVEEVRFDQKGGGRIGAEAENASETSVEAIVPEDAATGKPQVVDTAGATADSPEELKITAAAAQPADPPEGDGGSGGTTGTAPLQAGVSDVIAKPARGYFMGKQARAAFVARGGSPQDVRVDVVRKQDDSVVRHLVAKEIAPGVPAQVKWNGKTDSKDIAPNGEYEFEVKPITGGSGSSASFEQYDHIFPVRGKHDYWAGLGDGRGHQGVDVGAKCGKRMVAARGGKVQTRAYHGSAGNYVVIDGKGTDVDYAYMHLQQPTKYKEGDKVKTGAGIGKVGDTGNAQGCHLHFEMWDGDWYGGGKVMDPMPHLKRWDGWS